MSKRIPMTVQGHKQLKSELKNLRSVERAKVIKLIAEAREHGDLKENAEYHSAREQQSFIEGRIKELEGKINSAQIIDIVNVNNNGKIIFGSTITLINLETEEKIVYQIVGEDEADIKQNKISVISPLSRALIGKENNDEILVNTPGGKVDYKVINVEYI